MTRSVLFVCTGNTCRSPMAASIFRVLTKGASPVSSAGTQAAPDAALSRGAAAVFAKRGLDGAGHRARRVDEALLDVADDVYVMERAHRDYIVSHFPGFAGKISVLREAAGLSPADVEDPLGDAVEEYEACASSIEEALDIIVRRESNAPNPR